MKKIAEGILYNNNKKWMTKRTSIEAKNLPEWGNKGSQRYPFVRCRRNQWIIQFDLSRERTGLRFTFSILLVTYVSVSCTAFWIYKDLFFFF